MRISSLGRFVFVAQWVAAVLLPVFFFIGRAFIGAEVGWLMVLGIFYGIIVIILMLVPPLIGLADGEARRAKATRQAYAVTSVVFWAAIVLGALTVPDQGDGPPGRPALTVWTGDAISIDAASTIFTVLSPVIGLAYLALLVLAIMGAVRSRRA